MSAPASLFAGRKSLLKGVKNFPQRKNFSFAQAHRKNLSFVLIKSPSGLFLFKERGKSTAFRNKDQSEILSHLRLWHLNEACSF